MNLIHNRCSECTLLKLLAYFPANELNHPSQVCDHGPLLKHYKPIISHKVTWLNTQTIAILSMANYFHYILPKDSYNKKICLH